MRQKGLVILGVVLSLFLVTELAYAEGNLAYVNLGELFDNYTKTKEYDKILEEKQKDYEKQREKKLDEVKKMQDKLSLLSEEEGEARRDEIEDRVSKLQEFDRDRTQDLRKQRDEKVKEIFEDIENAIKAYAKDKGFSLVFDRRALVYDNESLDITDEVLKILNKKR